MNEASELTLSRTSEERLEDFVYVFSTFVLFYCIFINRMRMKDYDYNACLKIYIRKLFIKFFFRNQV